MTKYLKRTGRTEVVLGETASSSLEVRADNALGVILHPKRIPGNTRKVRVVSIAKIFFDKYAGPIKMLPRPGQVFASALEASISIGAHSASVTSALSRAKRVGQETATIRGVKFAFAE
jgi:hypothetical protein